MRSIYSEWIVVGIARVYRNNRNPATEMHVALVGLALTVLGVLWAVGLFFFGYGDGPVILSLLIASVGL